ncbi:hypothetical protein J5277_29390 [Rhizobium sp. 16-449-1b]|uniref:hypothetical protein n=1 Tax=Rhizobium sp. 16-449-1b TaxID=2819989 RepID=UPI000645F38D|nr:hypothetical protein [Rhizobium sp. 16-449-1b]MBO9198249.1 hypothetical protein [Rhizobium sp. 16-449-1b]
MSHMHLVDHLDAAKKIAELSNKLFLIYLIDMAKDEVMKTSETAQPHVRTGLNNTKPSLRLVQNHTSSPV